MIKNLMLCSLVVVLGMASTGCGTLFYGERKGKEPSNYADPAVVVLDGCLLFLGVIPGVVAFAVDFNNNTAYFTKEEYEARAKK